MASSLVGSEGAAPAPDGLRRLAAVVGAKEAPRTLRRLRGGIGALTHVIALGDRRLVLKRYPVGAEVDHEWDAMVIAHRHGLPAPEPLALDSAGDWFGRPSLAMSLLPGRALLDPQHRALYAADVAHALASVHDVPLAALPPSLRRRHAVDLDATPSDGHLPSALVERITHSLRPLLSSMVTTERVFNHGDFHPGNLVWAKDRLSGVVDWSGARPGPRWSELAYFRVELAVLVDIRLADAVLETYEQLTGRKSPMQAAWDLLHVLDGYTWMHLWLEAYRDQGCPDMTLETTNSMPSPPESAGCSWSRLPVDATRR